MIGINTKLNYTTETASKLFFTSDTHFGHKNIINFCKRPWNSVEEMDQALIDNWNSVVDKDATVFHLGDFAFATNRRWREIVEALNGKIYLIIGNHDETRYPGDKTMEIFKGVYSQLRITVENKKVYLNHYPFLCYGGTYRGDKDSVWQLFGHVHTCPNSSGADDNRMNYKFPYQYDVGVDNNNYKPVNWNQIKEYINKQILEWKSMEKLG